MLCFMSCVCFDFVVFIGWRVAFCVMLLIRSCCFIVGAGSVFCVCLRFDVGVPIEFVLRLCIVGRVVRFSVLLC